VPLSGFALILTFTMSTFPFAFIPPDSIFSFFCIRELTPLVNHRILSLRSDFRSHKKPMILLIDHFNLTRISRHRTVAAAIKARIAHARRLNRNSPGSFIWYRITDADGVGICGELQMEIERTLQTSAR